MKSGGVKHAMPRSRAAVHLLALILLISLSLFQLVRASTLPHGGAVAARDAADPTRPFAVFGYLPEYRLGGFPYADVFAHGLTHLIFFSAEVDAASGALTHTTDRLPQGDEWATIREAADRHGVRLMLCIGGGGRSAGFAAMVSDPLRRAQFVKQLCTFLLEKGLDGVDINWEYPQGEAQWRDFARLVRELRSSLGYVRIWDDDVPAEAGARGETPAVPTYVSRVPSHDVSAAGNEQEQARVLQIWRDQQQQRDVFLQEKRDGNVRRGNHRVRVRDMTLSMAVHPQPDIAALLSDLSILPWLDYLHWMAYDHIRPPDPHSSVEYAEFVLSDRFTAALSETGRLGDDEPSVRRLPRVARAAEARRAKADGDHRRKLTLGIPFYGRHREDLRLEPETYERLQRFIAPWAAKKHPEWLRDGPGEELKSLNEYTGYAFSSYRDVQAKMRLARHSGPPGGIAGVMIWELGQDMQPPSTQPLSLMRAVGEQLRRWNATRPTRVTVRAPPGSTGDTTSVPPAGQPQEQQRGSEKGHDSTPEVFVVSSSIRPPEEAVDADAADL